MEMLKKIGSWLLGAMIWALGIVKIMILGVMSAVIWVLSNTLGRYFAWIAKSADFRRGAVSTVLVLAVAVGAGVGVMRAYKWARGVASVKDMDMSQPIDPSLPEYVEKVRVARDQIGAFNKDVLPYVLDSYNKYVSDPRWVDYASRCLQYEKEFKRAEKLTLYPWIMTAGIALHESRCDGSVVSYDNGRGLMQITKYMPKHTKVAGELLSVQKVNFVDEPFHNIVLGIVIHDDYERRWSSREHGMLSYNRGVGGTRSDLVQCGWRANKKLLSVTEIRPCLTYKKNGWKPRTYVPSVLATTVIMNRLVHGEPLVRLDQIRESDIPGWDPSKDGETHWFTDLWKL